MAQIRLTRCSVVAMTSVLLLCCTTRGQSDPNDPGIIEPCLTAITGVDVRIPNTDQADGDKLLNVVGGIFSTDVKGSISLTGHVPGKR